MWVVAIFVIGYVAIVLEHPLRLNKAASALIAGGLCWTAYVLSGDARAIDAQLMHHMGELSQILFFLLGAMTIVELIDAHDGFELITSQIKTRDRRRLLVTIALLAFFLSAVLDNLTTSIVMMSLVKKLASDERDRMYFGAVVIIAANAGGAWSPIGDVTTTMLWIGGQVTTPVLVKNLIIPSLVSVIVPLAWIAFRLKGHIPRRAGGTVDFSGIEIGAHTQLTLPDDASAVGRSLVDLKLRSRTKVSAAATRAGQVVDPSAHLHAGDVLVLDGAPDNIRRAILLLVSGRSPEPTSAAQRNLIFFVGVGMLLFVPVFKTITHLPPFMGILLGLGVLWAVTRNTPRAITTALERIDTPSILFFLGILLAISALASDGKLAALAGWMETTIGNVDIITMTIGLSSAVVDNVPLVAAAQGMYSLQTFPQDNHFWVFLAYCAGTGGSILIIGSAAGIAVMGMQRISFGWYLKRISLPTLLGYVAGALAYLGLAQL